MKTRTSLKLPRKSSSLPNRWRISVGRYASLLLSLLLVTIAADAVADPPAHAPAHGWRKKHDPYVGYSGAKWENDYRITSGSCDREAIGAVLGGVAGGVVGSKVASPENRTVGVLIGAIAGALVGARIGRELDDADRGCVGHALEIARPGSPIMWVNRATGVSYTVIPGEVRREGAGACRDFTLAARAGKEQSRRPMKACNTSGRGWKIV
jgi:surface antigen